MTDQRPLIAHVVHRLGIGGLENGLVNLINFMPADCYRHAVICLAGYTEFAERIQVGDTRIYDLEKSPGKNPKYYLRLFRLLREIRPDIMHTRNIGTLDCQFIAAAAGVPHRIHGEHGWDVGDLYGRHGKHVLLRRMSRTVVDRYMVVSIHMGEWLKNVIGIPAERVTQIYNGIDTGRFLPRCGPGSIGATEEKSFVIGTVGRLDPIKDHFTLLRAFVNLLERLPSENAQPRLAIVGDGEMRQQLEDFVVRHRIESNVSFEGASNDVATLLQTFDVFVLSSLNEGVSNTVLEAMAAGLPVLATDAGGNPELVIDGVTGALFEPGDSGALAALLLDCIERPGNRRKQGEAGRARAMEEFGMQAMTDRYLQMYDSVTGYNSLNRE